jgi:4-amino-4-deoxy-L-arabinose transferase
LAGAGCLLWGVLTVLAGRARRPEGRLLLFGAAPLLLFAVVPFAMPSGVAKRFPSDTIRSIADRIDEQTILVTDRSYIQPMCWELKRSDVLLIGKAGEVAYGLEHSDGRRHLTHAELDAMLRDPERSRAAVCVLDDEKHEPHMAYPEPEWVVRRPGMLLMGFAPNR